MLCVMIQYAHAPLGLGRFLVITVFCAFGVNCPWVRVDFEVLFWTAGYNKTNKKERGNEVRKSAEGDDLRMFLTRIWGWVCG
jgi:hypothetical protein